MNWLPALRSPRSTRPNTKSCRPAVEALEERAQPSATSLISSNFNGTAIHAGSSVWFSSVGKVTGLGTSPVHLHVTNASVDFTAAGSSYHVAVPDADILFSPGATSASTTFDAATNTWETTAPSNLGGNVFLAGATLNVPNGLPGGINPVNWTASFSSDTAGVSVSWQWAAAVYSNFGSDYGSLNVKPVDSNSLSAYKNSDHAGTPEAFKSFVLGGARGGGGSNWTGSYSATKSVTPDVVTAPPPSSLSGTVFDANGNGVGNVAVTLTGYDSNGNYVSVTVYTDQYGNYDLAGLTAGNYSLTDANFDNTYTITLAAGTDGTYNFYEVPTTVQT